MNPSSKVRANVDYKAENDWTALHFACWLQDYKMVNMLLFNGASVDPLARNDLSPLMVICTKKDPLIFKVLKKAGASTS